MPVSYTHLDVYKRQRLPRSEQAALHNSFPPYLSVQMNTPDDSAEKTRIKMQKYSNATSFYLSAYHET